MSCVYKSYRFKLKPSVSQEARISSWMDTCRFVYNLALETKKWVWCQNKIGLSKYDLMRDLTPIRHEHEWVQDVPVHTLQGVIDDLDMAYKMFFNKGGIPRYKKKGDNKALIFKEVHGIGNGFVKLPKIGRIRMFKSRVVYGVVTRAYIKKECDGYYVSIETKQERETIARPNDSQVGIDMGIAFFASLSTGKHLNNPRFFEKYQRQLRIEQRSLSRKVKGSSNWCKQKRKVVKIHAKIKRCRADFLHKQSTKLVNNYGLIAIEDLKVKNMLKFGHLGKSISDAGWSTFFNQLEYKTDWYGGKLVKVNPAYTSQACSDCGSVDKKSRISQSKFVCTECGVESNADVNAAKNILAKALANVRKRESVGCALGNNPKSTGMSRRTNI